MRGVKQSGLDTPLTTKTSVQTPPVSNHNASLAPKSYTCLHLFPSQWSLARAQNTTKCYARTRTSPYGVRSSRCFPLGSSSQGSSFSLVHSRLLKNSQSILRHSRKYCLPCKISPCEFLLPISPLEKLHGQSTLPYSNIWDSTNRLVVGFTCCTVGGIGMCYLWWQESDNHVWLVGSIFVPGWFSGIAGLISTFVSIYTHKNGGYGASSIASIAVTGASIVICGLVAAIYSFKLWLLRRDDELAAKSKDTGSQAGTESGTEK